MLKQLKNRKESGFTIIEVLIVLAIAALILLIVFLAVPALQRNSRNTQRRNDVAAILAAVSEYENNNSGSLPNGGVIWTNNNGILTVQAVANDVSSEAKVSYYNAGIGPTQGSVDKAKAGTPTPANTLSDAAHDYVIISTGTDCSGVASQAGSTRSVSAVYEIENGSNSYKQQCQSS